MIFSKDPAADRILATLGEGESATRYTCGLIPCPLPTCQCGYMRVEFTPYGAVDGDIPAVAAPHKVGINIPNKTRAESRDAPEAESDFERDFFGQMRDEDYHWLQQVNILLKRRLTEIADFDSLTANFPFMEIERNSLMISYLRVLPYAKPIAARMGEEDYYVEDQYCVRPECTCREVILTYFPLNDTVSANKPARKAYSVTVDYKKRHWEERVLGFESYGTSFVREEARRTLELQEPDLYKLLQERHERMKQLYANSLNVHSQGQRQPVAARLPVVSRKAGRNDPCPCGSGKKYKKCCGG